MQLDYIIGLEKNPLENNGFFLLYLKREEVIKMDTNKRIMTLAKLLKGNDVENFVNQLKNLSKLAKAKTN